MAVRDIRCPNCGEGRAVHKRDLGEYYCPACDTTFTPTDLP